MTNQTTQSNAYDIDYLTIVVEDEDLAARVGFSHIADNWFPVTGMWGYDQSWQCQVTGVRKLRSSTRPEMGVCFQATGKAIQKIKRYYGTEYTVRALDDYGLSYGRATRIDLALDYFDGGATAYTIATLFEAGMVKTTARKGNIVSGLRKTGDTTTRNGITVYIGARTTSRFVRVYDKATESKGQIKSTRFEMEAKDYVAQNLWKQISGHRSPNIVKRAVLGTLTDYITSWGDATVDQIFSEAVPWQPPEREDTEHDLKAWLSRQVIPTLIRSYRESPNGENLFTWLNDAVSNRLHEGEI